MRRLVSAVGTAMSMMVALVLFTAWIVRYRFRRLQPADRCAVVFGVLAFAAWAGWVAA